MADWQTTSSEIVYETPWMKVRRDEVLNHNGKRLTYSYIEGTSISVYIVALNEQHEILLQRNFTYPIHAYSWDLPAGYSDGEDLLVAAQRELMEEAGLASDTWVDLGNVHVNSGLADVSGNVFVAHNVYATPGERDELEDITEQRFMSQSAIDDLIQKGKINVAETVAALYLARLHLNKKEQR